MIKKRPEFHHNLLKHMKLMKVELRMHIYLHKCEIKKNKNSTGTISLTQYKINADASTRFVKKQ